MGAKPLKARSATAPGVRLIAYKARAREDLLFDNGLDARRGS
jgi:hypothetical protein